MCENLHSVLNGAIEARYARVLPQCVSYNAEPNYRVIGGTTLI